MPFIDLNLKKPAFFSLPKVDNAIIGAGTAGIFLAVALAQKGKSVLVIESGHFGEDEERQKLNAVKQTGKVLRNAEWGRKRAVGGTTISWGGQSLPFTPIDFEERDWVQNSGWPISFSELEPYFKKADALMDIDILNYTTDIFPKIKVTDNGINKQTFDFHVAKWTNHKNFYSSYKQILEEKVFVVYNAQLTNIHCSSAGDVDSITVCNFKNDIFIFPVFALVIAAGTIETIRILLANNLGAHSGLLGKYFMDHPCVEIGSIQSGNLYKLQKKFNTHIYKGRKYSLRLSLSREFQKKNQLLNCSASIMFKTPKGSFDVYNELKLFKKDFRLKRILKIGIHLGSICKSLAAYLINKFIFKPNAAATISLMCEQEPEKGSYITLCSTTDAFGVPEAVINWDINYKTWHTIIKTSKAIKQQIESLNVGQVNLYKHLQNDTPGWKDYLSDVCHNMGGCRMSYSPGEGVVDTNLQVWNIPNLFVCSQAVFPTGSHSNPVLTMLALALRLADHLAIKDKEEIKRGESISVISA